jgi:hypothetical protein
MFHAKFRPHAQIGDSIRQRPIDFVQLIATICADSEENRPFVRTDDNAEDYSDWKLGKWIFGGLVISAYYKNVLITAEAAKRTGIRINQYGFYDPSKNNKHLTRIASAMEEAADATYIPLLPDAIHRHDYALLTKAWGKEAADTYYATKPSDRVWRP